ncbi:NADH dehydrogenase [ubiquinone] 1 beta subcomplex subunit 2, mitochondrial-like [Rhynchophorus ferrugineus]|uniref:Uncharacterized protein n=1 Tax=Rhynchophorus ferrugineus TaxID=354439 RepID=A0A834MBM1_RHYFE|nr:hypothetical protein GWI33_007867 [Rhynchophorus ferrugineus]
MIISRGASTLRTIRSLQCNAIQFKQSVRNSGHGTWNYRKSAPPPRINVICANIVQGVAWWWILWHLWTEPGHVFGEFEYPDPTKWTDEELGIPEELELE